MCRNKAENIIPVLIYITFCWCVHINIGHFKHFVKNRSITSLVLFFVLLYLLLSPFVCCDFIICILVLLVSFSHALFFYAFLSLALLHPLSLRETFQSVRTPWHSGSGIRAHLLLYDLPKNPSLSAAWYVPCLEVLCRGSRESWLWCSLSYPHAWVHIDLACLTSPSPFCSPPPLVFGTFRGGVC